eukprot:SAG11_NODE_989_length_6272_cov_18.066256_3_plen_426_part_00
MSKLLRWTRHGSRPVTPAAAAAAAAAGPVDPPSVWPALEPGQRLFLEVHGYCVLERVLVRLRHPGPLSRHHCSAASPSVPAGLPRSGTLQQQVQCLVHSCGCGCGSRTAAAAYPAAAGRLLHAACVLARRRWCRPSPAVWCRPQPGPLIEELKLAIYSLESAYRATGTLPADGPVSDPIGRTVLASDTLVSRAGLPPATAQRVARTVAQGCRSGALSVVDHRAERAADCQRSACARAELLVLSAGLLQSGKHPAPRPVLPRLRHARVLARGGGGNGGLQSATRAVGRAHPAAASRRRGAAESAPGQPRQQRQRCQPQRWQGEAESWLSRRGARGARARQCARQRRAVPCACATRARVVASVHSRYDTFCRHILLRRNSTGFPFVKTLANLTDLTCPEDGGTLVIAVRLDVDTSESCRHRAADSGV